MPSFLNIRLTNFAFTLLFVILLLNSCNNKELNTYEPFSISGSAQGTTYTIIADQEKLLKLQSEIDSILLDFDRCLSSYRDSSIVSIFSNADSGTYVFRDINNYFGRCFNESVRVYELSNGAFDPSIFPLVANWGFLKDPALEMTQNQIDSVMKQIGFVEGKDYALEASEYDKHTLTKFYIKKIRPSLKLDFNAIAQGLSVDVLCEFLEKHGFQNYYVEIGGELRVKGKNKAGELWRIGIDLADENNAENQTDRTLTNIISLNNRAVATSGSYRKFYEKDGKKFSHTIDPTTGYPVQHNLLGATVVAENAAFADAMATVFMVWGVEKSIEFVKSHPDLKLDILLQFVDDQGEMSTYYSSGMRNLIAK